MIDINDYFYFVHVVEKQGFSAAALALNMPKSRLSRHVAKLEERLDIKLIERTSRQFRVTDAGEEFYRHALSVVEKVESTEFAMLRKKQLFTGRVVLSCSIGVAQYAIKNLLLQFLKAHPGIEVVQQVTNQNIDLVAAGVDLAIRGHMETLPDSSNIQRKLARVSWCLVASPNYLAMRGMPRVPLDLQQHQSLKLGWQPTRNQWQLTHHQGSNINIPIKPQFYSDDMNTLIQAAQEGLGIVSLPAYTCRQAFTEGSLVRVLPDWKTGQAQLSLITPSRRSATPPVQALHKYLFEHVNASIGDDQQADSAIPSL